MFLNELYYKLTLVIGFFLYLFEGFWYFFVTVYLIMIWDNFLNRETINLVHVSKYKQPRTGIKLKSTQWSVIF